VLAVGGADGDSSAGVAAGVVAANAREGDVFIYHAEGAVVPGVRCVRSIRELANAAEGEGA
jgi:hypothetical protein